MRPPQVLIAIPVFNEQKYVTKVLDEVRHYARDILVIDDGSTDETPLLLARQPVEVIRHARNRGYGQSMIDAFRWAQCQCYCYDWLITMDCDEQHQPASLPDFYEKIRQAGEYPEVGADVISGSRYLDRTLPADLPPADRRAINAEMTQLVNQRLGLKLTDAFCGFKAYRVAALGKLALSESGYAFPLQFWVQAVAHGLHVQEVPIKLIYNDPQRVFGGPLNDPQTRLAHYKQVFFRELAKFPEQFGRVCTKCLDAADAAVERPTTPAQPTAVSGSSNDEVRMTSE